MAIGANPLGREGKDGARITRAPLRNCTRCAVTRHVKAALAKTALTAPGIVKHSRQ